ncbi:cupin [candidate division KSB1 bacterium]|nr:cupin [candidate division KSB1 bacterium]
MPIKIDSPTVITAAGNVPKEIKEYIGRVNTKTEQISIAHMKSPAGWAEPGQQPEFNEYTVVLKGVLVVETQNEKLEITAGQAVIAKAGERVRYSSPYKNGAEYIAVCLPAFSPETVNRDE